MTVMMILITVLLYGHYTVTTAENERELQRNLDLLNEYCNCNKLKVNISKTKMMVFAIPTFTFGNTDLDQVEDYMYLGICWWILC